MRLFAAAHWGDTLLNNLGVINWQPVAGITFYQRYRGTSESVGFKSTPAYLFLFISLAYINGTRHCDEYLYICIPY